MTQSSFHTVDLSEPEICVIQENHKMLTAIFAAKISYTVRKYASAWVPVVINNGKRTTFTHCATSGGAMSVAIREAFKEASQ